MNLEDEVTKKKVEEIIRSEVAVVKDNPLVIKQNGCAACYILFSIVNKIQVSEQDAADLLSEVLLDDSKLNDDFIAMVEDIHMRCRYMGTTFAIKNREAKDRYIESNFKNALAELLSDASNLSSEIVLRKLILSHIALSLAQNIGIDFHAANEELYYYMRKKDDETHKELLHSIRSIISKGQRTNEQSTTLLDIRMPHMRGFQFYEKIRKMDSNVKVCFMTGFDMHYEEFKEISPSLASSYFIRKPLENDELVREVNSKLAEK